MTTHYVPMFTTKLPDGSQLAVCGTPVIGYTTEPSCPACKAWLEADSEMLDVLTKWSAAEDLKAARRLS